MFESAELGHHIDKTSWARQMPRLREALLDAQADVLEAKRFSVIVVVGGVDGAGKGETVNLLNEWLDPRHVVTRAMGAPDATERTMPTMWRFWNELPPKGKIGIMFGSWYTMPIVDRVYGKTRKAELQRSIDEILSFEKMLTDEGICILKLWFHLSKKAQRTRLAKLEADKETRWRVTPTDWKHFKLYDEFRAVSEDVLRQTSTGPAPWSVIDGVDARYRGITAGNALLSAMNARLAASTPKGSGSGPKRRANAPPHAPAAAGAGGEGVLRALDLSPKLSKRKYEAELEHLQGALNRLSRHEKMKERSVVAVFEGSDAAGKGGAIRRITGALDARRYEVIPIAAPTEEERAHTYLWRFWRRVPRQGHFAIFDRSWYGRVLVERVEELCPPDAWMRAYREICDFEDQLIARGAIVAKFWLATSKDVQLQRFREREKMGFKRYKITAEDWRNREKWDAYEEAANDMIDRTSTAHAPWTLVPANDKGYARIAVLRTLCEAIEGAL
jgi:polyphosphate:AMP phosphotransferase